MRNCLVGANILTFFAVGAGIVVNPNFFFSPKGGNTNGFFGTFLNTFATQVAKFGVYFIGHRFFSLCMMKMFFDFGYAQIRRPYL